MKKKGFTLIELLAVIVILAIIALIVTPIISNVIDASRKAAFKESVDGIIDSTASYVHEYILAHNDDFREYPVVFTCDGNSCKTTNNEILTFKGNVPKSGRIIMQDGGVLAEYITDGKYCAYGYKWDLVVENSCGEVDATKPTITGTQSGKTITLSMTDNESGIYGYCVTKDVNNCTWRTPTNPSSEEYTIEEAGTWYFLAKDNKGNISDSINFTTVVTDYCTHELNETWTFSYIGNTESFPIPCKGTYKLEVWGAQGGAASGGIGGTTSGTKGAYASGNYNANYGETLFIAVGGKGGNTTNDGINKGSGGFNGGGSGNGYHPHDWAYGGKGAGGGATSISTENETAAGDHVIIVAGGGPGAAFKYENPKDTSRGSGSAAASSNNVRGQGTSADGGDSSIAGGGGGGYYGGNRGYSGTSYVEGLADSQTIAGNASMPTHDGTSTMTGNSDNGYAIITLISY